MLKIGHEVVRPGKFRGDEPITIPVPEELETVPGIPLNNREVDWYAREYPLESMTMPRELPETGPMPSGTNTPKCGRFVGSTTK